MVIVETHYAKEDEEFICSIHTGDKLAFDRDRATAALLSRAYLWPNNVLSAMKCFLRQCVGCVERGKAESNLYPYAGFTFRFGRLYCAIYRAEIGSHLATL